MILTSALGWLVMVSALLSPHGGTILWSLLVVVLILFLIKAAFRVAGVNGGIMVVVLWSIL